MGKDYKVLSSSKVFPVEDLILVWFGGGVSPIFMGSFSSFPHSASGCMVVMFRLFSNLFSFANFLFLDTYYDLLLSLGLFTMEE